MFNWQTFLKISVINVLLVQESARLYRSIKEYAYNSSQFGWGPPR